MNRESAFVPSVASVDGDRCVGCGFCQETLYCPSPQICIGCGVCAAGCPAQARTMVADLENNIVTGLVLVIVVLFFVMGIRNAALVGL